MQPKDTKINSSIVNSVPNGFAENIIFDVKAKIVNLSNKKNPANKITGFFIWAFEQFTA